jgi:hypothetical protein
VFAASKTSFLTAFSKIQRILGHVKTFGFYGCEALEIFDFGAQIIDLHAVLRKHRKSMIF